MFILKRVEKDEENKFTVSTSDGFITIAGESDFVVRMVKSLCQESTEFLEILRDNLIGETQNMTTKICANFFGSLTFCSSERKTNFFVLFPDL